MEPCKKKIKLSAMNNTNYSKKEDRLSQLPQDILIDILSLVPIHTAASTSILSRQWRNLWTHVRFTNLSLPFPNCSAFESFECFITTVEYILSLKKSSNFQSFELNVPNFKPTEPPIASQFFSNVLTPRIEEICTLNPQEIKLRVEEGLDFIIEMPTYVFQTRSLVFLQLHATPEMEFKFPNSGEPFIDLPNLKKLDVILFESQRPVMDNIFKSCPLLEDLDMYLHLMAEYYDIDILAPNLKRLFIGIQIEGINFGRNIVIEAPKLEYFHAYGYLASYEFVHIPSNLQEATISIAEDCIDEFEECIVGLLRGISCVRSLTLLHKCLGIWEILDRLYDTDDKITFPNLIHLTFMFLRDKISGCLLGNLKKLEIWDNGPGIYRIESLKHILRKATVLDKLHLSVDCDCDSIEFDEENYFCTELFKLDKSSSCDIAFSGPRITASSKDYVLSSQ